MSNMHSVDSDNEEEEISLNNYYSNSEEYYEIFGKVKSNQEDAVFSKYIGKNRIYVYILLKLFNPFSKIILRVNTLSKIIKYRYDKKQIYVYYDPNTRNVSSIKKIVPFTK